MKSLFDLFNLSKYRKSIPKSWCGKWLDKKGNQLIIKSTAHDFYYITVLDPYKNPFEIELLGGLSKSTMDLKARFAKDLKNLPILQVEAGSDGIGPTYNLYFLKVDPYAKTRLARNSDNLDDLIIVPDVGMGLYNDWEVDLGVPWAFPLENFKKIGL